MGINVVRRQVHEVGSCQNCHACSLYVYEFVMGSFVARLCSACMEELIAGYRSIKRG